MPPPPVTWPACCPPTSATGRGGGPGRGVPGSVSATSACATAARPAGTPAASPSASRPTRPNSPPAWPPTCAPPPGSRTPSATGHGYLTITVTPEALTEIAVRVAETGPACARSDALAGTAHSRAARYPAGRRAELARGQDLVIAQVTARLAAAAGATVTVTVTDDHGAGRAQPRASLPSCASPLPGALPGAERALPQAGPPPAPTPVTPTPVPPPPTPVTPTPVTPAPTPVTAGVAFAGLDAITYALARIPPEHPVAPRPGRVGAARPGQSRLCCSLRALLRCVDAALGRCP